MSEEPRLLLLDKHAVERLLTPERVQEAVREAFLLHSRGEGRVFPLVREKLADGVFGIKSGVIAGQGVLGFKAAGFWPGNRPRGGEPHQATIMLFDPATGRPLCLIDGNAVTTWRTGAAGALGLAALARPESARLCVFGTGVQARIQTFFALRALPALRSVRYLSADGRPSAAFEAKIESFFAGRGAVRHATEANAAVAESEVVITATPGGGPLFDLEAVEPGTHFNAVGADTQGKRELPEGLLAKARLFVDDAAQARQIGETQWSPQTPCIALGDILDGKAPFSRRAEDITVFDMTGFALQDLTVARMLQRQAEEAQTDTRIAWPW